MDRARRPRIVLDDGRDHGLVALDVEPGQGQADQQRHRRDGFRRRAADRRRGRDAARRRPPGRQVVRQGERDARRAVRIGHDEGVPVGGVGELPPDPDGLGRGGRPRRRHWHRLERAAAVLGGEREFRLDTHLLAAVEDALGVRGGVGGQRVDRGVHDAQRQFGGDRPAPIIARRDDIACRLAGLVAFLVRGHRNGQLLILARDFEPHLLLIDLVVLDDGGVDADRGEFLISERQPDQRGPLGQVNADVPPQSLALYG